MMMISPRVLKQAHTLCTNNAALLCNLQRCGCFHCCSFFASTEIKEWIDDEKDPTAICPRCGIDAVIGEKALAPLTGEFLEAMHDYWFDGTNE